jgi:hypothetical protein
MARMRCGVLVVLAAAALPFLPVGAPVASADEGSPVAPASVSPRVRPPAGVLRHVDTDRVSVSPAPVPARGRELVVLVGGYQSCACPDDGTFDALRSRLAADGGFDVVRFGADPRFPYDTFGPVAPNAIRLRDEIRALAPGYDGVHVVTHSMGGVVADQAFANGLSRDDGVVSYVSWSAPHSGSDAARALVAAGLISGTMSGPLREGLLWLRMEEDSPAVRDLATASAVAPPAGVLRLDLRESTDVLVTGRDARDPGVPSRVLNGQLEGHGGILADPSAIEQTVRTITERRIPPEDRPRAAVLAAERRSEDLNALVLGTICVLACVACATALVARSASLPFTHVIERFLPRATRRPCP